MLLVSTLNTIVHNWVLPKTVVDKFSFNGVKLFTDYLLSLTTFLCSSVFKVGGCLASCLTLDHF